MIQTEQIISIWEQRIRLEKARRAYEEEQMRDYDRDEYYPAMKALRQQCAESGHSPQGKWHDNGIGWSWRYCSQCADRLDITGPAGPEAA
jgi:hypothetical protein